MAHRTLKNGYSSLAERLNRPPQGAPPSELLFKILKILFREREAELVALLPIRPFTAKDASWIWNMDVSSATKVLDGLASRALLVDWISHEETRYVLPPPMAGFFEFSLMRVRDDIDQKTLSELFYQYLNVEEDFVRELFTTGDTQLGRVFVHEPMLPDDDALEVLDYERASHAIQSAEHIGIGTCYCRHKMQHMDKACEAPMNICMTFNTSADSLIRHGHARRADASEGLDLLEEAYKNNLVQFGENVQNRVGFLCNCCGCCCEAMVAARQFAILNPVHTTNFLPVVDCENCTGCAKCVNVCPVEAMSLVSANDSAKPRKKVARVDLDRCLGCGVCVRSCEKDSLRLESRPKRVLTPVDGMHRVVRMAVERGKLQNLIFDNRVLWSHRALGSVLGAILTLPPVQRSMARSQFVSRYLDRMITRASAPRETPAH